MGKEFVLVAEPDAGRAESYRALLANKGYDVEVVNDGSRAILALARGAPSLVLLELALPKLDGFALLKALRKKYPDAKKTPAIVVSAFREMRDAAVKDRAALGITELLAKSSPMSTLDRVLDRTLGLGGPPSVVIPAPPPHVMSPGPVPLRSSPEEQTRLFRIASMNLVDEGPPDESLQKLVAETAKAFSVPIALVSLVLEDKQWFKAHYGLQGDLLADRGTPRDWSFCRHVVDARTPMVVADAVEHPLFRENPLVKSGIVRGYAGAPLVTPGGHVLGTLCILDTKTLQVGAPEIEALTVLAKRVAGELELRAQAKRSERELAFFSTKLKEEADKSAYLHNSLTYLEAVLSNIEAGVLLFDEHRKVVFVNSRIANAVGRSREEIVGRHRDEWLQLIAPLTKDPQEFLRKMKVPEQGAYSGNELFEVATPRRAIVRWVGKPVPLREGVGQLSVFTDITAEHDLLQQNERLALEDVLTGLPNRRSGEETLKREVSRALRVKGPLSVVIFDIDHFKKLNDTHGHGAGDEALRQVARALQTSTRTHEFASRWGGEEFLCVLQAELKVALIFAERARAAVEALQLPTGKVTVSAGVAQLDAEHPEELVDRADQALYQAKSEGRNRVLAALVPDLS